MTIKHTPGPWRFEKANHAGGSIHYRVGPLTKETRFRMVAWLAGGLGEVTTRDPTTFSADDPEIEADARLIAAAPDLLAALIEAEEDLADVPGREDPPALEAVRAAIAKARGDS